MPFSSCRPSYLRQGDAPAPRIVPFLPALRRTSALTQLGLRVGLLHRVLRGAGQPVAQPSTHEWAYAPPGMDSGSPTELGPPRLSPLPATWKPLGPSQTLRPGSDRSPAAVPPPPGPVPSQSHRAISRQA
jgi:hypothetical protein